MRAELDKQTALSTLYRKRDMILGTGGRALRKMRHPAIPKSNVCVNPDCNAFHTQSDHPFADMSGKVNSHTPTSSPIRPIRHHIRHGAVRRRRAPDGGFHDVDISEVQCRLEHAHGIPHQGLRLAAWIHALFLESDTAGAAKEA